MHTKVAFKGFPSSEALKDQVEKRLDKLSKYLNYPLEMHVILSVKKDTHRCEITCHAEHKQLFSECETLDMHEAIDRCVHKLEARLKKERERRKGHLSAHRSLTASENRGQDVGLEVPHRGKR